MDPEEFLLAYARSGREGGVEKTLAMIDPGAVYWFSDGSAHVGLEAIEAAIRHNAEAIQSESYGIKDIVWLARSDEVAACVYGFEWSGLLWGQPASGAGRGSAVLVRSGESWRIVHEHLSKGKHRA